MSTRARLLAWLVLGSCMGCTDEPAPSPVFTGELSAIRIDGAELGEGMSGPTGLVVDDVADLSALSEPERKMAEMLVAQTKILGVRGFADFTYREEDDPLHQITLRVFVFDSEASCRSWWKTKYEGTGWEKHYERLAGEAYPTLSSTQMAKRIVRVGNVLLTCGTIAETEQHLDVLAKYVAKITGS